MALPASLVPVKVTWPFWKVAPVTAGVVVMLVPSARVAEAGLLVDGDSAHSDMSAHNVRHSCSWLVDEWCLSRRADLPRPSQGRCAESHSPSFDQRRRPDTFFTAMATAFFCPTSTT